MRQLPRLLVALFGLTTFMTSLAPGQSAPCGSYALPLTQVLSQVEVQRINRCGHMASIEQPEQFFGVVNRFLRRHLSQGVDKLLP